jgi:hypothetical protein
VPAPTTAARHASSARTRRRWIVTTARAHAAATAINLRYKLGISTGVSALIATR